MRNSTKLDLSYNEIGNSGAKQLGLRKNMMYLPIVYVYIVPKSKLVTLTAQGLAENTTLAHLVLYNCEIGADGMTKLATALHNNLRRLNLGFNQFGSKGVESLGKLHNVSHHSRYGYTTYKRITSLKYTSMSATCEV